MLDTLENIEETEKMWKAMSKKYGSTEEVYMSSQFDYLDEDDERLIKEKKNQAQRFIFDISSTMLTEEEIVRQIKEDVFRSTHTLFVQEIVLIKDMKLLGIYHRK